MYKKIIELVNQSKGWSYIEHAKDNAENVLIGVSEEELYSLPTATYVTRRYNFLNRALTVYHAAFQALADFKDVEVPLHSGVLIYILKMNKKVVIFYAVHTYGFKISNFTDFHFINVLHTVKNC